MNSVFSCETVDGGCFAFAPLVGSNLFCQRTSQLGESACHMQIPAHILHTHIHVLNVYVSVLLRGWKPKPFRPRRTARETSHLPGVPWRCSLIGFVENWAAISNAEESVKEARSRL